MTKLEAAINKLAMTKQASTKQASTRREALVNLATLLGAGAGGIGGGLAGAHLGARYGLANAQSGGISEEDTASFLAAKNQENASNRLVKKYIGRPAGIGALGLGVAGATTGGYTARQLAELLLKEDKQRAPQIT